MAESKIIPVRYADRQVRFITREAKRLGLSVSAYLRFLIDKERER